MLFWHWHELAPYNNYVNLLAKTNLDVCIVQRAHQILPALLRRVNAAVVHGRQRRRVPLHSGMAEAS